MPERLLIAAVIILLGVSVYAFYKGLHMLGASRLIPALSRPTVLYFRSDSCGPCVAQARYLEQLHAEFDGRVAFEKIDADRDLETAGKYGVFTLPTTMVVDRDGTVRHINYGLTDARRLTTQLRSVVGRVKPLLAEQEQRS